MIRCPSCGASNKMGNFCGQCGRPLTAKQAPPGPSQQRPPLLPQQPLLLQPPGYPHSPQSLRHNKQPWLGMAIGGAAAVVLLIVLIIAMSSPSDTNSAVVLPDPQTAGSGQYAGNPFLGVYGNMRVSGAAYTTEQGGKTYSVANAGALAPGSIAILPNGTYAWNSNWDGKLIYGVWQPDGKNVKLLQGQEGADWIVMWETNPDGEIIVSDGNVSYVADRLR